MIWRPRSSRYLLRLLLLAGVVLLAASITQCRMVTDQLMRPSADALGAANSCVDQCVRAAKEAKEEENERHEQAVRDCRGGDDGDDDLTAINLYRRDKGDKDKKDDHDKKDKGDRGDKDDKHKNACLESEEARHKAALKAIEKQRRECVNGCHHQGGGFGR